MVAGVETNLATTIILTQISGHCVSRRQLKIILTTIFWTRNLAQSTDREGVGSILRQEQDKQKKRHESLISLVLDAPHKMLLSELLVDLQNGLGNKSLREKLLLLGYL